MRNTHANVQQDNPNQPKFQQIVSSLKTLIEQGLDSHQPLPSERLVAEQFSVSRMTARRALEAVEAEGLAYSEHRKGRFVSPKRLQYDINRISFAADAAKAGIDLSIELIDTCLTPATEPLAEALRVTVGEILCNYTRLFSTDGHPNFIESEYLVAARFPDLTHHDLRQSTSQLLEQYYHPMATSSDIIIRMRALSQDESQRLGVKHPQSGVELEQTTYDQNRQPVCFSRQIWRGELAEFAARTMTTPQPQ